MMLSEKKYGITIEIMAQYVVPRLTPQTVNATLSLDQYTILMEVCDELSLIHDHKYISLHELIDNIVFTE